METSTKKPQDLNDLFAEIVRNARSDRGRLEKICDSITSAAEGTTDDSLAGLGLAENMAQVTDSLTRNNAQLVEVAKILSKAQAPSKEAFDERMYDEIEGIEDGEISRER